MNISSRILPLLNFLIQGAQGAHISKVEHLEHLDEQVEIKTCANPTCATLISGAINTTKQAGNLPDSEVFSRPNTSVLGLGAVNRKATGTTCFVLIYPAPPNDLSSHLAGFQFNKERETMTKVNSPTTSTQDTIARQQAIENALSAALYFIRLPSTPTGIRAATGRTNRALSMLKQACNEANLIEVSA